MPAPAVAPVFPGHQPAGLRWLMWGLPTLLFFVAFLHRPAPGVLAKDLMQAFDADGTIVGLLAATYFYAYAALMIPVVAGARVYPVGAYRTAFAVCAVFALAAALASLLVRETRGKNVHAMLAGAAAGRSLGAERPA